MRPPIFPYTLERKTFNVILDISKFLSSALLVFVAPSRYVKFGVAMKEHNNLSVDQFWTFQLSCKLQSPVTTAYENYVVYQVIESHKK